MKTFLLLLAFCIGRTATATTYYFSSTSGDDSRTSSQAQNQSTPWKTLSKLNSFFSSLNPGDVVLFQKGDVFPGSITPTKDGSSGNPITFGAYGSGAKPVISGFTTVAAWTSLGANIWESSSTVSGLSTVNMVLINGVNTPMGRYPNSGYMPYQGHSGNTSITSSSLTGSPNWTGAEAVIRKYRWVIDRDVINSQSGSTISFTNNNGDYDPQNGYGFFIQDDVRTLDVQNEWYYNPSTKKLRIYSSASPSNVKVSAVTNLLTISSIDYLTFDNLSFQGANEKGIYNNGGSNLVVNACDILFSGTDAVNSYPNAPNIKIEYCTINHSNNAGINAGASSGATIRYNTIRNSGVFQGMGRAVNSSMEAITANGNNSNVSYNTVDTAGYNGIKFAGDATVIKYNYVNYVNFNKDDGGGIYCYPLQGVGSTHTKRTVQGNIVLNSIGAASGTNNSNMEGHGIYNDGADDNVDYLDNTIANCKLGLFFNNGRNSVIARNTIYNCERGFYFIKYLSDIAMSNVNVNNNIFFANTASQYPGYYEPMASSMPSDYLGDNNYYARPIDDNQTIWQDVSGSNVYRTLAQWKAATGKDANSKKSPVSVSTVNDLRLEFNSTAVAKTISLGTNYIDVKGISYAGSITLQPYSSAILIKSGAGNATPAANAGTDQVISLPTANTNLAGTGTDPDGTISTYAWTKVSGASGSSITSSTSAATAITGLAEGVYKFELKVTDNGGASARDTIQLTVNASENPAPTANAGEDKSITLPTSTVTLTGSGTDPGGSISWYAWVKASGPTSGTITSPASASTSVTGLAQGTYQFELTVSDNGGAVATDIIQVTVNLAGNQAPTANAGADTIITLPVNSVSLTGSGTDVGGTISSYAWTKISGPASGSITNATSASATASSLMEGVYSFELKVTDNGGAVATDVMQVTVNPAVIAPPVSKIIRVNIFNGTVPFSDVKWNNWKPAANATSSKFKYEDQTASTVTAVLNKQSKIQDNGATYLPTATVCPAPVLRFASADKVSRTLTIKGLDVNKLYSLEFFASASVTGNKTEFVIGGSNYIISTDNNKNGYAEYFNVRPNKSGNITVTINKIGTWNYLNGFNIIEQSGTIAGVTPIQSARPQSSTSSNESDEKESVELVAETMVSVYPNPFVSSMKVQINGETTGIYILSIANLAGKTIWSKAVNKPGSSLIETIIIGSVPAGAYFLQILAPDQKKSVHKLIKGY